MADNYMQFSEVIKDITLEEAKWIEAVLSFDCTKFGYDLMEAGAALADLMGRTTVELAKYDVDITYWPTFDWRVGEWSLWLCDNGDSFCFDEVILFVESFIKKWRPDYVFSMTWAGTCSKPRVGEFGGGWVHITKDRVEYEDTWSSAACEANLEGFHKPEHTPRWKLEKFAHLMLEHFFWDPHRGRWGAGPVLEYDSEHAVVDMMQKCGLWPEGRKQLLEVIGERPRGDDR